MSRFSPVYRGPAICLETAALSGAFPQRVSTVLAPLGRGSGTASKPMRDTSSKVAQNLMIKPSPYQAGVTKCGQKTTPVVTRRDHSSRQARILALMVPK